MKKTLALVLTLLVAFSMFTVAASALTDTNPDDNIRFVYQSETETEIIKGIYVAPVAENVVAYVELKYVPEAPTSFVREDAETGKNYEYTFKGWKSSADPDNLYYNSRIPVPTEGQKLVVYEAQYVVEEAEVTQNFWQFVKSIFERINILFEYFATIFNF